MVNQGKGAAVKTGVLYSRGDYVLMLDADGATDYNEIKGIYNQAKITASKSNQSACVIGSRNLLPNQAKRTPLRKILNFIMNILTQLVLGSPIKDT
jgi:dolichyl-phosphate beta-glucosyltransferase